MSQYDEIQVSEWLREGVAAAQAGRRAEARALLMRVIEANERNEQAWLWLSGVVDTDEERLICLENVLTLNPDNVRARAGMKWLQKRGVVAGPPEEEAPEAEPVRQGYQVGEEQPDGRAQELVNDVDVPQYAGAFGPQASTGREQGLFMTPDGCVYCGLLVGDKVPRCPHCGGQLTARRFKQEERSLTGQLLPVYWIIVAVINFSGFALIGVDWDFFIDNVGDRVHIVALGGIGAATALVSSCIVRLDLNGLGVISDCAVKITREPISDSTVVVHGCIMRITLDRLRAALDP